MRVIQKIIIGLLALAIFLSITILLPLAATAQTITSRNSVKDLLVSRPIYDLLVKAVDNLPLNEVGAEGEVSEAQDTGFDPEALKQIIDKYFTYEFYQRAASQVVEAVFDWLDGKTDQPTFEIVVVEDQAAFQQFIIDVFVSRYSGLPACASDFELPPNFDPLSADCRPSQVGAEDVRRSLNEQLKSAELDQLFNQATISSQDLLADMDPGSTAQARFFYQLGKKLPLLSGLVIIGLVLLVFLVTFNRHKAFKTVGLTLLLPAGMVLIGTLASWLLRFTIINALTPKATSETQTQVDLLQELSQKIFSRIELKLLLYSLIIVVLGIACLIVQRLINKKQPQPAVVKPTLK
ncbi:hypothetical protein HY441_01700 [Candidatus Microgenomates bacterium]|nr:hypothetical protein [Candidatus Microgenomates bacterium]